MGLSNDVGTGGGGGNFVSIVNGKWSLSVAEGTEGAVMRENKNGKQVWEIQFTKLDGRIEKVEFKDVSFGTVAEFYIIDGEGERFKASMTIRDQHLMTFCKILPNIDLDKEMDLILALDKEKTAKKGKNCYGLIIQQDGEWLKHHWKRGNLPEAEDTRSGLNFTKQEDFLLDELEKTFSIVKKETVGGDEVPF